MLLLFSAVQTPVTVANAASCAANSGGSSGRRYSSANSSTALSETVIQPSVFVRPDIQKIAAIANLAISASTVSSSTDCEHARKRDQRSRIGWLRKLAEFAFVVIGDSWVLRERIAGDQAIRGAAAKAGFDVVAAASQLRPPRNRKEHLLWLRKAR